MEMKTHLRKGFYLLSVKQFLYISSYVIFSAIELFHYFINHEFAVVCHCIK
jgi:hypothetical protein